MKNIFSEKFQDWGNMTSNGHRSLYKKYSIFNLTNGNLDQDVIDFHLTSEFRYEFSDITDNATYLVNVHLFKLYLNISIKS